MEKRLAIAALVVGYSFIIVGSGFANFRAIYICWIYMRVCTHKVKKYLKQITGVKSCNDTSVETHLT